MIFRPHRVGQESLVRAEQALASGAAARSLSSWADLPREILQEVLTNIEASQDSWRQYQRSIVACAGVCRSWRYHTKEIVEAPEVSGRFIFPASIKQPGPKNFPIQSYVRRNRSTQTFYLFITSRNEHKVLLVAKRYLRVTGVDYVISLGAGDVSKRSSNYIGTLRSNFVGTRFTVYDGPTPSRSFFTSLNLGTRRQRSSMYPAARISYESHPKIRSCRGPRVLRCDMDSIPASSLNAGGVAHGATEFSQSNDSVLEQSAFQEDEPLVLKNKVPKWDPIQQYWTLDFNGRVLEASVKNFQMVAVPQDESVEMQEEGQVILQFGKFNKDDLFSMDYQYPLSTFQAFAICLTSFEHKFPGA